jgi:hypothetical protein
VGTLVVSGKAIGRRKALFEDFSVPLPPGANDDGGGGSGMTLRDLIALIVRQQVKAFHDRQDRRQFVRALSAREIEQGVEAGKVDAGGREPGAKADPEEAVAAALQGFEDGLYLVVLDGQEQRDLDAQIYPRPDSRVTFVRLVFLAGA